MLVIVEYGNVQRFFQSFFYFKTAGRADIFQIDAAEARRKVGDSLNDLFRILRIQTVRR